MPYDDTSTSTENQPLRFSFLFFCLISVGYYLELRIVIAFLPRLLIFLTQYCNEYALYTKEYDITQLVEKW